MLWVNRGWREPNLLRMPMKSRFGLCVKTTTDYVDNCYQDVLYQLLMLFSTYKQKVT